MKRYFNQIHECIAERKRFLITTHINPDGDSISSVLVFASILRYLKKPYRILVHDTVPPKFSFLEGIEEIRSLGEEKEPFDPDTVVVLDSADLDRLGSVRHRIPEDAIVINMDHHASNQRFGHINVIDDSESSAVEMVYELAVSIGMPIDAQVATMVYTGILCDTGRFHFPNTNERSLKRCAEMVRLGAVPDAIAEKLYYRMSHGTIRALAAALSTIEFHYKGTVSSMVLSNGCFTELDQVDTEGFVDHLLAIDGTEVEFFMVEKNPGTFRVSFRSKSQVDVNALAGVFGGGGHVRAAGCTLSGTAEEVKSKILAELGKKMDS